MSVPRLAIIGDRFRRKGFRHFGVEIIGFKINISDNHWRGVSVIRRLSGLGEGLCPSILVRL